jgi:hypothetical protein
MGQNYDPQEHIGNKRAITTIKVNKAAKVTIP